MIASCVRCGGRLLAGQPCPCGAVRAVVVPAAARGAAAVAEVFYSCANCGGALDQISSVCWCETHGFPRVAPLSAAELNAYDRRRAIERRYVSAL